MGREERREGVEAGGKSGHAQGRAAPALAFVLPDTSRPCGVVSFLEPKWQSQRRSGEGLSWGPRSCHWWGAGGVSVCRRAAAATLGHLAVLHASRLLCSVLLLTAHVRLISSLSQPWRIGLFPVEKRCRCCFEQRQKRFSRA